MNPTKAPKRRLNSDWLIESPSKVFLRQVRTDELRSSSGVFSESTTTTASSMSTFDNDAAFEDISIHSEQVFFFQYAAFWLDSEVCIIA